MDDTDMRFQLLLRELESIQQRIRAMDTATFTIKGWCVTVDFPLQCRGGGQANMIYDSDEKTIYAQFRPASGPAATASPQVNAVDSIRHFVPVSRGRSGRR